MLQLAQPPLSILRALFRGRERVGRRDHELWGMIRTRRGKLTRTATFVLHRLTFLEQWPAYSATDCVAQAWNPLGIKEGSR